MRHHPPLTAGHLEVTSALKLYASAYARRVSGTLVLRRKHAEKRVYILEGRLVGAASNQPSESLGTLLVCQGWIDVQTYAASLTRMDEGGRRHGEILVDLGALRRERLEQALRLQNLARLSDAGTWTHGTYAFEAGLPPKRGTPYPLWSVLQSATLQRFGRTRVIDLARAREDAVCVQHASLLTSPLIMLPDPLLTLGLVDGKKTVGEIVRESNNQMLTFVNLLVLRSLEVIGFSSPRHSAVATSCIAERRSTALLAPR